MRAVVDLLAIVGFVSLVFCALAGVEVFLARYSRRWKP